MFAFRHFLYLGLLVILLIGCKASPPDEGSTEPGGYRVILSLSSPNQVDSDSFPNGDEVTIKVRLLDSSNKPVKSELIKVATTLGTLSSDSILTDSDGYATSKISPSTILGAGSITATFGAVSTKVNFELLALQTSPVAATKISLSLQRSGLSINRFKSNEVVQLRALITDADGLAVSNQVVTFATELGSLDVETGLTDSNGVAQVNLSATNITLGASEAIATAKVNGVDLTASVNYEIIDSNSSITDQVIRLGHFNNANTFVEDQLGISIAPDTNGDINISAGATLGISLAIVDENNQRIMLPTKVSFGSNCVESKRATIGTDVATINGVAVTTYEDVNCGGGQDSIQATVTVNNQTKTLVQTINIAPENIGSIEFVSSSPESIVLKGTGGQGQQETSTLTFLVKGSLGNPLAQQAVTFSLNTAAGNLTLTPATSLTNSAGLVTTKVNAGNVPTAVRVTAAVTAAGGQVIQTQSDLLSVNTGMADQDSFSLAPIVKNPEADQYDGEEVLINARLSDAFNNPVPDGTTINFTTEGGSIAPSCNTIAGACSVKWISGEPRVPNHRITILATAVGHETFNDTNGSNTFDDADGAAFYDPAESGLGRVLAAPNGFFDMSEAWRDDNENKAYESGEKFIDFNNDQIFNLRDSLFNGPQCSGLLCGTGNNKSIHVRKALVMVMSGSHARLTLMRDILGSGSQNPSIAHVRNRLVYATLNTPFIQEEGGALLIPEDGVENFALSFADFGAIHGQTLPEGTTIQVSTDAGTLNGETTFTIGSTVGPNAPDEFNGDEIHFSIKNTNTVTNPGDSPVAGLLKMTATTPKGNVTTLTFNFGLAGI